MESNLKTLKQQMSDLPKTWFIDLDGTLVMHNSYILDDKSLLPGVREFMVNIDVNDTVIITTARPESSFSEIREFLNRHGFKYDLIITGLPVGERIVINDRKPSGLDMAHAINLHRNGGF